MTTASVKPVLIDTSVWVEYFRKAKPFFERTEELIEEERVCTTPLIVAEILQGSRSDTEFATLQAATEVFEVLDEDRQAWIEAARLSSRLRRKGKPVGLADCLIAVLANRHDRPLWSLDKHFRAIRSELPLHPYSP